MGGEQQASPVAPQVVMMRPVLTRLLVWGSLCGCVGCVYVLLCSSPFTLDAVCGRLCVAAGHTVQEQGFATLFFVHLPPGSFVDSPGLW